FFASTLADISFVRNVLSASFPLFSTQMYHLGNLRTIIILAALAVLMVSIPFILKCYGKPLRERSPWTRVHIEDWR
ncbi:hypothetical protein BKA65DRAFT_399916, partial [Rhexocercosporidium sp. MPI-PUGE-AT-0058]